MNIKKTTLNKMVIKEQIRQDVINHYHTFFSEYDVPEIIIKRAVDDVMETSAFEDEGFYSDGDISLGCQRAIIYAFDDFFNTLRTGMTAIKTIEEEERFSNVYWTKEDIVEAFERLGEEEPTEEMIEEVYEWMNEERVSNAMIEAGWNEIENTIICYLRK